MPNSTVVILLSSFFMLCFIPHYIRTWAFGRYEAVTFECSSISFLISMLILLWYGYCWQCMLLMILLLTFFLGNAFFQRFYYDKLQRIINSSFEKKTNYILPASENPKRKTNADLVFNRIYTLASFAIMPSFSRWIEESNPLNSPVSIFGFLRKRSFKSRFQHKKYQMRESFAELANLIGLCVPRIREKEREGFRAIPEAIHANDLALDYCDEKKGLLAFDILGFGSLIAISLYTVYYYKQPSALLYVLNEPIISSGVLLLILVGSSFLCYELRRIAFARHESLCYELSSSTLVATSFILVGNYVSCENLTLYTWLVFGTILMIFLALSIFHHYVGRRLHKRIDDSIDRLVHQISPDSETNRTKRRFLQSLAYISTWAIIPAGAEESKNPHIMTELIKQVAPELSEMVSPSDFMLDEKFLRFTSWVEVIGVIFGIGLLTVSEWKGVF